MTIGEIIEALGQGKALADIAKELTVGKEKISKALKNAGYLFNRGTGWTYTGADPEPLNKDYTDFISSRKGVKKSVSTNVPTKELTNVGSKVGSNEQTKVVRKRSSFDIDIELMKDLKIQAVIHDKNVYEIVENAIRKELAEMKRQK
ncbi:hypothetical protein [Lysinibacillus irui]|uniref:hypothetical protein n=1 Tax=Lysinibacillus irui TaxID=2998077 RepID=UPI002AD3B07C|nr:hypothetical protein [Lysinibacillus irui]MEA0564766.1 hypothetical protein [Lysinibacillus irui]